MSKRTDQVIAKSPNSVAQTSETGAGKNSWMECMVRRARAVAEFDKQSGTSNGALTANSLAYGLTLLRNSMFARIHEDVEKVFGMDSMLLPISQKQSESRAKTEIEIFQIAVSIAEVKEQSDIQFNNDWYLSWLGRLRLGEAIERDRLRLRLDRYLSIGSDQQRLMFSNVLVRAFPEAIRAPLVLFRLFPLAIRMVTAMAFGDHFRASDLRNQQVSLLPAISDCPDCHGRPLENGEQCKPCGNPLWNYRWLQSMD